MSQQHRFIQLLLVGALLLCALAGVYLFAWKRFAKPGSPAAIKKHRVDAQPDDVLKHWTADKMRSARPVELPNIDTRDRGKQRPRGSRGASDPHHSS